MTDRDERDERPLDNDVAVVPVTPLGTPMSGQPGPTPSAVGVPLVAPLGFTEGAATGGDGENDQVPDPDAPGVPAEWNDNTRPHDGRPF